MYNMFESQEAEEKRNVGGWWRWPLIPFAAVGGACIAALAVNMAVLFGGRMMVGGYEQSAFNVYVLPLIQFAFFGYCWAGLACLVAPKGKAMVGAVMTGLLGLLYVFAGFCVVLNPGIAMGTKLYYGAGVLLTFAAASGAVWLTKWRNQKRKARQAGEKVNEQAELVG